MLDKQLSRLAVLLLLVCLASACAQLLPMLKGKQAPQDKGGIYLVIAVKADKAQLDQSIEETIATIRKRCERLDIYCKLQRQSGDQIMLRFSSPMDSGRVKKVLLAGGIEMREVVTQLSPAPLQRYPTRAEAEDEAGADNDVLPYDEDDIKSFIVVKHTPIVTGDDIRSAEAVPISDFPHYYVSFTLKPEGAARLKEWSGSHLNYYLAVIMNKSALTVAYIRSEISDAGEISGRFTKEQAEDISQVMMSGNLPAPIELLEEGTYKP
jgi:preprotein translocase subunit SecD